MLGFAARATSSFPFAFEPVLLRDVDGRSSGPASDAGPRASSETTSRHGLRVRRERVAFADGGYLDNKPFSYATEALRSRRADVPVTRVLALHRAASDQSSASMRRRTAPARPDVIANLRRRDDAAALRDDPGGHRGRRRAQPRGRPSA